MNRPLFNWKMRSTTSRVHRKNTPYTEERLCSTGSHTVGERRGNRSVSLCIGLQRPAATAITAAAQLTTGDPRTPYCRKKISAAATSAAATAAAATV